MLKIIAVGDPHFQCENIPDVELFIEKLEKLALDHNPDLIVILGDLLHTHERLHTIPLNKAYEFVDRMRQIAPTYVLVGNHDMCFAGDTEIMLHTGESKLAKNIIIGDILRGDDNTPRVVLNLKSGKSRMFVVNQENKSESSYTISQNHILSLKTIYPELGIVDIPLEKYLQLPLEIQDKMYGFSPDYAYPIDIQALDTIDYYYGWETDGNNRFLLYDNTVVHNCNNQQFLTKNHWMNAMKEWDNVKIIDEVVHVCLEGINIVLSPYVFPGRFQEALNTCSYDWKNADLIICHQEFFGCKMGAIISVEGDRWPDNYPKILSGHIHGNQKPQENIYYCGSSMQHAFGESEHNIIPILKWDTPNNNYSLEEVDLGLPRKRIVYTDIGDIDELKLPKNKSDKIKISVAGEYSDFKTFKKTKKYKDLIKAGTKVVFNAKKSMRKKAEEKDVNNSAGNEDAAETDFNKILSALIIKEKNTQLYQVYELLVNNKVISDDDIFFTS